jgi:glycosyltransferase involved in cell wall biosynthesis
MAEEFQRHGIGDRISVLPYPLPPRDPAATRGPSTETGPALPCRLLFLGRMELGKGGRTFLDALPPVRSRLGRPLHVTFAGDGPDRNAWESRAAPLRAPRQGLDITFVGWVDEARRNALLDQCDLLVVPSLWPEPFGLVGVEAGARGVPAAAFQVGGISEWLTDGVNGHLAPGDPPTAAGLAGAIINCLVDPLHHSRLRRGAVELAGRFSVAKHLEALLPLFERVAGYT